MLFTSFRTVYHAITQLDQHGGTQLDDARDAYLRAISAPDTLRGTVRSQLLWVAD